MNSITLKKPDDWHVHLRDGDMLKRVLPYTSKDFARAIIMPNLVPPVCTTAEAMAYKQRILSALPNGHNFTPLMVVYLTEDTQPDDLEQGYKSGAIQAVKLYPAGATTNSESGVKDFGKVHHVFERMAQIGMPLLVHGEVVDADIDIFDREAVFIDKVLEPIVQKFPALKVVMEHITTKDAADYIRSKDANLAATITPHHLMINRNAMLVGGIKPHYYCLPIVKRESHRLALVVAAVSGDKRFFLGTDSAPHSDEAKLQACGCAGVFNAPNAIICCATLFEQQNALNKLEGFLSINGPTYYGLPVNEAEITLVKTDKALNLAAEYKQLDGALTVFDPLTPLFWRIKE
ncbi:MAG: dihydroorotase [Rhizobiales bacterium]|nr:dihydroorotase [Hyphomicrobiales bacterium]NRB13042.1 dihydroorotase [Hyphomicrobiales bacterium]